MYSFPLVFCLFVHVLSLILSCFGHVLVSYNLLFIKSCTHILYYFVYSAMYSFPLVFSLFGHVLVFSILSFIRSCTRFQYSFAYSFMYSFSVFFRLFVHVLVSFIWSFIKHLLKNLTKEPNTPFLIQLFLEL